jgi:hypothetical protein
MVIDCQLSGASGDMILSALLGAGANESKVKAAIESVKDYVAWCKQIMINVKDVMKGDFRAKKVDIQFEENNSGQGRGRSASEIKTSLSNVVNELELSAQARGFASRAIDTMVEAEAKVHGEPNESEVELNELGTTDTIADIVGVTAALDDLHVFDEVAVYSTPVAVGGGLFKFSHGIVQSPGPVALEILRKFSFPIIGGPVEGELITPTGASLLVNMVHVANVFYPDMKPYATGYGAGSKDIGKVANILRIVIGNSVDYNLLTDRVYVLETNLDDVNGEIIGYTVERLMNENVRDVSVVPIMMKKNRPGQMLKAIVDEKDIKRISRIIIDETGSLGVRAYPVQRYVVSREIKPIEISVKDVSYTVRVKIVRGKSGEATNLKPEFEDASKVSHLTGRPLREIEELIREAATKKLKEEEEVEGKQENEE